MRSGERTQKKSEREQRADRAGSKRLTDSGQTGLLCRPKPEVAWKFLITLIHCAPNQTGFSQPPGFYLTLCFVIDFFFLPPFIFKAGYEHRGVRLHCLWMENFPEDCSYSLGLLPPVLLGEVHMTSRVCQDGFPAENEESGDTSGPRDQKEEGSWQNMFQKNCQKEEKWEERCWKNSSAVCRKRGRCFCNLSDVETPSPVPWYMRDLCWGRREESCSSQVEREICSPVTTMDVIKQQLITSWCSFRKTRVVTNWTCFWYRKTYYIRIVSLIAQLPKLSLWYFMLSKYIQS